ncbi:adenylate/guanylate cyclase domain-containing protein [Ruegeria jejuensis]|uniref:adenylate/guanylate cyclase domain-containing protein n=1 Tax=Ruegeria jejuensis TaxID=3233338 RepID=UPI00355BF43B
MAKACVLISDITGSTKLYESVTQREALNQISLVLARMRSIIEAHQGNCVKSQGDDTLSFFDHPDHAFLAAKQMVEEEWSHGMSVHAGLFFGEILSMDNDIYGDAVNTSARLASLAKPGELLIGDEGYDQLSSGHQSYFVSMGGLKLKGKKAATRVYSYMASQIATQTVVFGATGPQMGRRTESAEIAANGQSWSISEGESLTIGRSEECDITLPHGWISRQHGKLELRGAQLEYTDHSSSGSSVLTSDGQEFDVHRRATLLNGEGRLLFGTRDRAITDSALTYATNDLIPD